MQYAFKDLMTHRVLQFALLIAIRCVLHRFKSQDIHRKKLFRNFFIPNQKPIPKFKFHTENKPIKRISPNPPNQYYININDPSAGSPTETLLRLHLPLNDKIYTTSLRPYHLLQRQS